MPSEAKAFGYKWVDENKRGAYRSRFTCADLKARYSKADLSEEVGISSPTPHAESWTLLDIKCLKKGYDQVSADVSCAFLIGLDPGDGKGGKVRVKIPHEYVAHVLEWIKSLPAAERREWKEVDIVRDAMLELRGDLCGRRPAGATFKNRFDEIMLEELEQHGHAFQRGKVDACVFTCPISDVTVIHLSLIHI